ncbi:hypothetical protein TWF173_009162 [Orbilia oligospora]|uniref:Uncharacterized protein n=1 Tax=Arthrobotrys oligospora (strain ATCC 24927 / CBS 115.81 / DSM 1491) TaxID=756982 RepID=G1XF52_ARTOA|nr:hypothetical protein AOL_s00080g437 [Orbilia oligospora ATCC 24927]EGX48312.1 hypothetical protein AOL_s00080g437 [Orbilia oligospora ATCC 24927]KAF3310805.1 hypothetical protein TWF173_009162 [Orbilia oligospora]
MLGLVLYIRIPDHGEHTVALAPLLLKLPAQLLAPQLWFGHVYPGVLTDGIQAHPEKLVDLQVGFPVPAGATVPEQPLASHDGGVLEQTTWKAVVVVELVVILVVVVVVVELVVALVVDKVVDTVVVDNVEVDAVELRVVVL